MDKLEQVKKEIERRRDIFRASVASIDGCKANVLTDILNFIDSLQEEPVNKFLNTESMIESYKQRLISQANGMKNSPLVDMCLASYKHGINETLDTLNLFLMLKEL